MSPYPKYVIFDEISYILYQYFEAKMNAIPVDDQRYNEQRWAIRRQRIEMLEDLRRCFYGRGQYDLCQACKMSPQYGHYQDREE